MRLSNLRALPVWVIVLTVSVSACSPAVFVQDVGYQFDPLPRVAYGSETELQGDAYIGLPGYEDFWKPSPSQVARVERAIGAREPVWRYGIQFVGVVKDGRELIIANGIRNERDIASGWIVWFHGGESFFQAAYDVEAGELLYFGYGDNLG